MSGYRVCYLRADRQVAIFYHPKASGDADVLRRARMLCPRTMTVEVWRANRDLEVLLSEKGRDDSRAA